MEVLGRYMIDSTAILGRRRADAAPTIVSRHAKLACRYLRSALRAGTWSRLRLHFVRILSHSTCSP